MTRRPRFSLAAALRAWRRWWGGWRLWSRTGARFLPFLAKRRGRMIAAFAFGLGYVFVGLLEPWILKLIIDNVVLGDPLPGALARIAGATPNRLGLLNAIVASLVLLAVLRGVFYYYQQLNAARAGQQTAADIRLELYRHVQFLCSSFHDRRRTGDLLNRLTADVKLLRDIFISLPLTVAGEIALLLAMIGVMLVMDWSLTLMALAVLPAIGLLLRTYQGPMRKAIRAQREREGDLSTIASEVLGAIRVVQGYGRERHEIERFSTQNKRSLRTGLKASRLEAKLRWFSEVAVAAFTALVLSVATRRVLDGALSPGDLLVFVAYLRTFNRPLRRISRMAERAARGSAAGERILDILSQEPTIHDAKGASRARRFAGDIAFRGVVFRHRDSEPVLHGIDLSVGAGEKVALIGPTGAGKSTLLNLITRFYDPEEGEVTIDGRDIRRLKLASLREQIAYVFQEPVLFAASVAENIAYGRPGATDEQVVEAARAAGIHQIIEALPDGYQTVLGERGGTLSGGQRQCVAIARAMIRNAPIVLLDEPTTGLDGRSSAQVVAALHRLMEGRTVIVVSHHLAVVRDVDRVIVIENGRITDSGTHSALASRSGFYRIINNHEMAVAS